MASIELDIIKERCDKLIAEERRELIDYLTASLGDKNDRFHQNEPEIDLDKLTDSRVA